MTKWNLPEGRKPLTDADMAALTRRLADTSIEQSELYQAAKRDAEEAEAYAAELEAKLAKAAEGLEEMLAVPNSEAAQGILKVYARAIIAELKGVKDGTN